MIVTRFPPVMTSSALDIVYQKEMPLLLVNNLHLHPSQRYHQSLLLAEPTLAVETSLAVEKSTHGNPVKLVSFPA